MIERALFGEKNFSCISNSLPIADPIGTSSTVAPSFLTTDFTDYTDTALSIRITLLQKRVF
jgi:hypothetical protein